VSLPSLTLGRLELRRFFRGRLTRIAVAGLVLLPLLYAGLYLWSFWDPSSRFSHLPVAMVVEDQPAEADGKEVHAGADLAKELQDRKLFGWDVVSSEQADDGVRSGKYYMSLTIPRDFSARIASPSGDGTPSPAYLNVHINGANSYIISSIAQLAFNEVSAAAAHKAGEGYFTNIFMAFGTLGDKLREAAGGAGRLAEGAQTAQDGAAQLGQGAEQAQSGAGKLAGGADRAHAGAGRLADGAGKAREGAATLHDGLGDARQGAGRLQSGSRKLSGGLDTLDGGAAKLAAGSAKVAGGVEKITSLVDKTSDEVVPILRRYPALIRTSALAVAEGADVLAEESVRLPQETRRAVERAVKARDDLKHYLAGPGKDLPPQLKRELLQSAESVVRVAESVYAYVKAHPKELAHLSVDARKLAAMSRQLAAIPDLGGIVIAARRQVDKLNNGAQQVASGAGRLADGTGQALSGADRLTGGLGSLQSGLGKLTGGAGRLGSGLGKLAGGADELQSGLGQLSGGAGSLESGLGRLVGGSDQLQNGIGELAGGAGKLASGLDQGAEEVPSYSAAERGDRAAMMSDPVRLDMRKENTPPNYGTGFAPFFVPLSLWVGAMITYMLLRPLNPRALAGTAPAWRIALAGWLPAALIGVLQMLIVLAVLRGFSFFDLFRIGLRLEAAHWAGLVAFLALATATFVAIVQFLNAKFGPIGKVLALVLLMLQLTSSAGTYPIQTSPEFFQKIQPFLPMPWVVKGMRHLVSGGDLTAVWQATLVLLAFLAGALLLTTLSARANRMWTMKRLHPALRL